MICVYVHKLPGEFTVSVQHTATHSLVLESLPDFSSAFRLAEAVALDLSDKFDQCALITVDCEEEEHGFAA